MRNEILKNLGQQVWSLGSWEIRQGWHTQWQRAPCPVTDLSLALSVKIKYGLMNCCEVIALPYCHDLASSVWKFVDADPYILNIDNVTRFAHWH